ncbi:MAG: ABC transporter permease [Paenibacillus sp. RIFOXYA1_FULL_44_5]|nr:MAG: ABC transporter permease [Paenibacillus sp. RIFOXYA1_FULL_44_5]
MTGYLFLLPWLIGFFGLALGPILGSLYLSFTRYTLLSKPAWIGLDNYIQMFTKDQSFSHSLALTFKYVLLSVPLRLVFALAVAMILNKGIKALALYRTVYYIPSLLGGSVAIAEVWKKLFAGDGLFNHFLHYFHIQGPDWVANPSYILYSMVTLSVWQFGSSMVIFLAGLKQIPIEIYEAAQVDGVGRARIFFRITLPLISPVVFFNLIMNMISSFQVFTPGYIIGDGRGGPVDSTLFYSLYLYLKGFSFFYMGYASALAWVMLLIIGIFTLLVFGTSRYWVYYADGKNEGR